MIVGEAGGVFGEYSLNIKILDVVTQKYEKANFKQSLPNPDYYFFFLFHDSWVLYIFFFP